MSPESSGFSIQELKYLNLLAKEYPNVNRASAEIINPQAILNLPKGTEHFVSDIHGEYDAFNHVIKNASGVIKNQITAIFGNSLRESEKKTLATLIYYPEQKLEDIAGTEPHFTVLLKYARLWGQNIHVLRLEKPCQRNLRTYLKNLYTRTAKAETNRCIIRKLLKQ